MEKLHLGRKALLCVLIRHHGRYLQELSTMNSCYDAAEE